MDPTYTEWLGLGVRWAHVITGIAWIGSSFYFMWLDSHLRPPEPTRDGIEGEIWLVHSGGFYRTEKVLIGPGEVPAELHWFKWEAAFTLITGLLLLAIVYYLGAGLMVIEPSKVELSPAAAIAIGIATLVVGWFVYDGLWRSPLARFERSLAAVSFALVVALAYGVDQVFASRAAFIHVGALIGTIMAVNVWVHILPAQQAMIDATAAGREADFSRGLQAKHRSVHNNYLTLPVVFVMLSSHYPSTFGHDRAWLILGGLFLLGAGVRHWFNLRNKGVANHWLIPAAIAGMVALAWFAAEPSRRAGVGGPPAAFAEVEAVVLERCVACHSAAPTFVGIDRAPKDVTFDTPGQIAANALRIKAQAVVTRIMPPGNATEMSEEERDLIARWVNQGGRLE